MFNLNITDYIDRDNNKSNINMLKLIDLLKNPDKEISLICNQLNSYEINSLYEIILFLNNHFTIIKFAYLNTIIYSYYPNRRKNEKIIETFNKIASSLPQSITKVSFRGSILWDDDSMNILFRRLNALEKINFDSSSFSAVNVIALPMCATIEISNLHLDPLFLRRNYSNRIFKTVKKIVK